MKMTMLLTSSMLPELENAMANLEQKVAAAHAMKAAKENETRITRAGDALTPILALF